MDSILTSVKKMLGISAEDSTFDIDIILHINSALMVLSQLGVGPTTGFFISDNTKTWVDLIGDRVDLEAIKSYIYLKVRLLFDPPSSSFVLDSIQKQITEFEWRLNIQVEGVNTDE